jgi:hypothetical protein
MHWRRIGIGLFLLSLARSSPAVAADLSPGTGTPTAVASASPVTASSELTATIDAQIAAKWQAAGTRPTGPASDAEFLRRVWLDLTGTIPSVSEARDFLDDTSLDKRSRLVERLLASPAYSAHMAATWKELLLPEAANSYLIQYFATDFDPWLRKQFAENAGYDAIVREILTVSVTRAPNMRGLPFGQGPPSPFAFFAAKDGKPENLAASTARLFLGVRLECAQCHDHPFARWKREQFWGYAAFFGSIERTNQGDSLFQAREVLDRRELGVPGTERVVQARFLDATEPEWRPRVAARGALADWMTAPDNPYFSRAAVNRVWAQLFGTGLVDPVDDFAADNAPSHPELLDELARQFVAHRFDFQYLIRAIVASRAYALSSSSAGDSPSGEDLHLFARMPVRAMTPVQLYESLVQAAGLRHEADQVFVIKGGGDSPRREFLEKFASRDEKPTEHQTSILQVLTLMNGRLMNDATSLERGGALPAVAESYFLATPEKIEALYLAALARRPRPEELDRLVPYVDRGGPGLNPKQALADVFWALLNSAEFCVNH